METRRTKDGDEATLEWQVVWNASRFVKTPGTNKRVRRARPESEWRIVPHPELQIVSDEVWQRVQDRQKRLMAMYSGAKKGLLPRSVTSPYLLSGILKCGLCGGNLIIVTGYTSYGHYPKYGCSQHFNRGACSNSVTTELENRTTLLRERGIWSVGRRKPGR